MKKLLLIILTLLVFKGGMIYLPIQKAIASKSIEHSEGITLTGNNPDNGHRLHPGMESKSRPKSYGSIPELFDPGDIVATGESAGIIAKSIYTNPGSNAITITIPAGEIPSTDNFQGFIVANQIQFSIPAKGQKEVDIYAICTNPGLDQPPKGYKLPLPAQWNTNSIFIEPARSIINSTHQLQQEGKLQTPFNDNAELERIILAREAFWLYSNPEYDPCKRLYAQLEKVINTPLDDLIAASKYTIDYSISKVLEASRQILIHSGMIKPNTAKLPEALDKIINAAPPSNEQIARTIKVISTGLTTGVIGMLEISNPTDKPVIVRIGYRNGVNPSDLYLPTDESEQEYVVEGIPPIYLQPGETKKIPIRGNCVVIRLPAVRAGKLMTPIPLWWNSCFSEDGNCPFVWTPMTTDGSTENVNIPVRHAPDFVTIKDIINSMLKGNDPNLKFFPSEPKGLECSGTMVRMRSTIPGSSEVIPFILTSKEHTPIYVPFVIHAMQSIEDTYDSLIIKGLVNTPLSGNREREEESMKQQAIWLYTSVLNEWGYNKDSLKKKTIQQVENRTNQSIDKLPEPEKQILFTGIDNIFETLLFIGEEAKLLEKPEPPPPPEPDPITPNLKEIFRDKTGSPGSGENKSPGTAGDPELLNPDLDDQTQPHLIQDNSMELCELKNFTTINLLIFSRDKDGENPKMARKANDSTYVFNFDSGDRNARKRFERTGIMTIEFLDPKPKAACACEGSATVRVGRGTQTRTWKNGPCKDTVYQMLFELGPRTKLQDVTKKALDQKLENHIDSLVKAEWPTYRSAREDSIKKFLNSIAELKKVKPIPRSEINELETKIRDYRDILKKIRLESDLKKDIYETPYRKKMEKEFLDTWQEAQTFIITSDSTEEIFIVKAKGECIPTRDNEDKCVGSKFEFARKVTVKWERN